MTIKLTKVTRKRVSMKGGENSNINNLVKLLDKSINNNQKKRKSWTRKILAPIVSTASLATPFAYLKAASYATKNAERELKKTNKSGSPARKLASAIRGTLKGAVSGVFRGVQNEYRLIRGMPISETTIKLIIKLKEGGYDMKNIADKFDLKTLELSKEYHNHRTLSSSTINKEREKRNQNVAIIDELIAIKTASNISTNVTTSLPSPKLKPSRPAPPPPTNVKASEQASELAQAPESASELAPEPESASELAPEPELASELEPEPVTNTTLISASVPNTIVPELAQVSSPVKEPTTNTEIPIPLPISNNSNKSKNSKNSNNSKNKNRK